MKRFFKSSIAVLLSVLIAVTLSTFAFADGTVTYDGDAHKFIFEKGSKYSPTDLFDGFKDVMPGDKLTQTVTVNNKVSEDVKIKVYMRATGAEEGSEKFLSQLKLTVDQVGNSNLFAASADEKATLEDWVCLGMIYSGGKIDLKLTLDVPITLGNEFQNAAGTLDWQFKVEEFPTEKDDPAPPTGDISNYILWIALLAVSLVGFFFIFLAYKRKKKTEQ